MTKIRNPKRQRTRTHSSSALSNFGLRISAFGFPSDFGFRPSDLAVLLLWSLVVGCWSFPTAAQPAAPPPPRDPLINLMLSQPKIDIESTIVATATFDPPAVRPGEETVYRVSMNALEASIEWPEKLKAPAGLNLKPGARGEVLQPLGPTIQPRTSFNYRVRASALGEFIIPEFTVKVTDRPPVTVPAARLQVVANPPPTEPAVPRLFLEIPQTNLFVGQAAKARIVLSAGPGGGIQMLAQNTAKVTGDNVIVDQGAIQQRFEAFTRDGTQVQTFTYETLITPLATGKLSVFAQGFAASRMAGPIVIQGSGTLTFGASPNVLIESAPLELNVRPLPREGELPGFTGAVGIFTVDPPALATNVLRVGEPVKLAITVHAKRGEASLARLVAPPAPREKEWQVFTAPGDNAAPQSVQMRGFAVFNYTIIPLTETAQATPPIPFSCFDPATGRYVDLTIPAVAVTVLPGRAPGDWQTLLQPNPPGSEEEKEPELSGLAAAPGRTAGSLTPWQRQAWFPLLQFAPAALFGGLWGWDRRRRFLEQHPEVILRRRARRALRRQWRALRHAARARDAQGFAAAAVNAMRVACAPHFPAEPRALVGNDVLQLLHETNGHAPPDDLVRRFFTVTDASRFAATSADATQLLALQPELELVLERLEAKL